jgi:hypothetical protein
VTAPAEVWIAKWDGTRLGVHASEQGAKDRAEAHYRELCAHYGRPVGEVKWVTREWDAHLQWLYSTKPEDSRDPGHFSNHGETVTRVEVEP